MLSEALRRLGEARDLAVQDARERGASWARLAEQLGVSKQTAHERYGRPRAAQPAEKITEPMF